MPSTERSNPAPRLILRFAAYTAVTLGLAGGAVLWFAHRNAIERAEKNAAFHTAFVADTILRHRLEPSDLERPVTGSRLAALDKLFRQDILVGGALRAKLYSRSGVVTYSNEHRLIGTRPDEGDAAEAITGRRTSDVANLNHEGGGGQDRKVLEAYVPVSLGHGPPLGAFEVYQDYGPVAADARSSFGPVALALSLALLVLYAALFPILRRVTRRMVEQVEAIQHQARTDGLTGLSNRTLFRERVEQMLASPRRGRLAVFLLDVDSFKDINDTLGHQTGDLVLQEIGQRLRALSLNGRTVARLGGDEFALVDEVGDPHDALESAERLRRALARPVALGELRVEVDASVGVAIDEGEGDEVESLLRRADVAMYAAKQARSGSELYERERDPYSPDRLKLVGELRRAMARQELHLHYQPQVSLRDGGLRGVEAVLRWQHPLRGLLPPDEFIPLAEHTALIGLITEYALNSALRQGRDWMDEGLDVSIAVNIAGRDLLDPRFPDRVQERIRAAGIDPSRVALEITESTIVTDPLRARTVVSRLNELGVRVALDDFGRGYSSLHYLKGLPVSILKIDKSFVINMAESEDDAVIVRSTIDLGHNLGLEVIAEGVENEETWLRLRDLGCDAAQGFYVGRPAPARHLTETFSRDREPRIAV